jgi:hypothetical protein
MPRRVVAFDLVGTLSDTMIDLRDPATVAG